MKTINFVLPFIAVCLAFTGVPGQMSFAAEGPGSPHPGKASEEKARPASGNRKILVAYFSHSGHTREIADQIHRIAGGDIFEIQSVKPYPKDYDVVVDQARKELDSGYRPALKAKVKDIRQYDVVFIGYPNWWSTVPAPVRVFLTEQDLSGKTIVPFCTHGGGGLGHSVADIKKFCPNSALLEALAVPGSSVKTAQSKVSEWLKKIKITK
jgi:flavodoxin